MCIFVNVCNKCDKIYVSNVYGHSLYPYLVTTRIHKLWNCIFISTPPWTELLHRRILKCSFLLHQVTSFSFQLPFPPNHVYWNASQRWKYVTHCDKLQVYDFRRTGTKLHLIITRQVRELPKPKATKTSHAAIFGWRVIFTHEWDYSLTKKDERSSKWSSQRQCFSEDMATEAA